MKLDRIEVVNIRIQQETVICFIGGFNMSGLPHLSPMSQAIIEFSYLAICINIIKVNLSPPT